MKRLFIAINLPKDIKKNLEDLEREIQGLFPEEMEEVIRWIKKDNLHITLLFIGSTSDEKIPQIGEIIKEVVYNQKPFSLNFKKICYGPPKKIPPRLVWLELERSPELLRITRELKKEAMEKNILREAEKREFSPHITLGRIRTWQWKRINPEERPEIEREISLNFEVKSIEIMESVLKRTGAEYSIFKSIKLT